VVQFFTTDPHLAFVKCASVSEAILTLMRAHNHRMSNGGRYIRVSFSSKDVANFDANQHGGGGGGGSGDAHRAHSRAHISMDDVASASGGGGNSRRDDDLELPPVDPSLTTDADAYSGAMSTEEAS
jgi:hypothetical protein